VKLRYNPRTLWFDPALSTYEEGDHVLVDTERGREVGLVVDPAVEVTDEQVKALKSPLKPVVRVLDELDFERIDELDAKGKEAMGLFRKFIKERGLDLKPVSVEFLFSGEKAVFYFSHDGRVDFRDLVRDLAAHFRIRIDMRQVGVRDEARIVGGLAHCGEEMCCARLGGGFRPVSIRMAKEQDLSLNPSKISGACGRLMCCLRYEFEAYKDFKSRAPKKGVLIETPLGQAKVIDFDTPREVITMRLEDGKQLSIPLGEFDCPSGEEGHTRPCSISRDAIDRCASSGILTALAALEHDLLQGGQPAEKQEQRRGRDRNRGRAAHEQEQDRSARRPRRAGRQLAEDGQGAGQGAKAQAGRAGRGETTGDDADGEPFRGKEPQASRQRPGQRSSGLRGKGGGKGRGRGGGSGRGGSGSGGSGRGGPSGPGRGAAGPGGPSSSGSGSGDSGGDTRKRRRRSANRPSEGAD
jgi:cell fate regulator YaaT (PSP1 superfamily)